MTYAFDLTPYYETTEIKPLLQNSVVKAGEKEYRADRIFRGETHCYVFIDISSKGNHRKPFARKPSSVLKEIKEGSLTVVKYI